MAICLKRVRGLKRVRVADAAWIWTEPHSMRLKVRLTIQKEVAPGAILQKPLDCEFVVRNQQCTDCRQQFENFAWTAAVQVRQRVSHKRTFFYLEQAILKKNAQAAAVKIEQFRDGLDFFFRQRNDAVRFVQFLKDCVPCRVKETKKLVSAGAISASRGAAAPSRHRRDSCPSHNEVGGFFIEFEAIRTASRDRNAPRRCPTTSRRTPSTSGRVVYKTCGSSRFPFPLELRGPPYCMASGAGLMPVLMVLPKG